MSFKASVNVPTASVNINSPSLNYRAPSVSIGGNLGVNASGSVGVRGKASFSIAAPNLKIEAPKI